MNIDKFTITSYDSILGFDRVNGGLELVMDELTDFTLSQAQETTDITGKGGRIISRLKRNKSVTGSGTNGLLSGGTLAAMLGATVTADDNYTIHYTDTIKVADNSGITAQKALGTAGSEIGTIYIRNDKNAYVTDGKKLVQVAESPKTGEFTYDAETKKISFFAGDVADGTEVIAFYEASVAGSKISNSADSYSKVLSLYVNCTCQDACDNIFKGQFIIPRADFSGEFDIAGGNEPATQAFNFTSLPDLCTGNSNLWDFILFE